MKLNEYEVHFLCWFLARIDITHIPLEGFLIAVILHKRLGLRLSHGLEEFRQLNKTYKGGKLQ